MTVDLAAFDSLFRHAMQRAYTAAGCAGELDADHAIVELQYWGVREVNTAGAARELYLGADRFFRIIDVSIHPGKRDCRTFFVRPSGHPPEGWDKTWAPDDAGPLKIMIPA